AVENFIRFLRAPIRVASQGEHRTGAWFGLLDQGYTAVLPTTQDTLFEYDRNSEFFTNWLALQALLPAPAESRPPLHLPVSAAEAARFHPDARHALRGSADGRKLRQVFSLPLRFAPGSLPLLIPTYYGNSLCGGQL
nr:hypothetical protein [Tanacetum cinerariifolium]